MAQELPNITYERALEIASSDEGMLRILSVFGREMGLDGVKRMIAYSVGANEMYELLSFCCGDTGRLDSICEARLQGISVRTSLSVTSMMGRDRWE